jgi:prepilin-type processing-associated H-X9-DG protein
MGSAFQLYLQDHDYIMPATDNAAYKFEDHTAQGVRMLRQYYRPGPRYVWGNNGRFIPDEMDICPSVSLDGLTVNSENGGPDYGMAKQAYGKRATYYEEPVKTPVIWDSWVAGWTNASTSLNTFPLRHSGGLNCVFLDGHVEWIAGDDARLWSEWWYRAAVRSRPDDRFLGKGWEMGVMVVP